MNRKEFERLSIGGERGFEDLCKLVEELGYNQEPRQLANRNGSWVSSLINFLSDNPGAIEVLHTWIADYYANELGLDNDDEDESGEPNAGLPTDE